MVEPVWTEERKALLRQLWADGVSTKLIAAQLGVSAKAVSHMRGNLALALRPGRHRLHPVRERRPKPPAPVKAIRAPRLKSSKPAPKPRVLDDDVDDSAHFFDWDAQPPPKVAKARAPQVTFWTAPGRVEKLRRLWAADVPAAEIGRALGCTKRAVIGKAYRLKLEPRLGEHWRRLGYLSSPSGRAHLLRLRKAA